MIEPENLDILEEGPAEAPVSLAQQALFSLPPSEVVAGALAKRFGVPPFSVLDTRQGYWKDRKREWLALGLRSELGRGEGAELSVVDGRRADAIPGGSRWPSPKLREDGTIQRGGVAGRPVGRAFGQGVLRGEADVKQSVSGGVWVGPAAATDAAQRAAAGLPPRRPPSGFPAMRLGEDGRTVPGGETGDPIDNPGTSIFDPVLCELSYQWYSAPGALVLDPFAGGSVRGIVAAYCGRRYLGVDLRPEQVEANEEQWASISAEVPPPGSASPEWRVGDSRHLRRLVGAEEQADLLFSCPPYFDLEVYSDDPDDLSRAASYDEFMDAYLACLMAGADRLKDDRFAVLVVSEIRDPKSGVYRGFVPDTIRACADAGLDFYNDAVLLNVAGSLPLRAGKQFAAGRKLGRSHQAVLTFVKGDGRRAADAAGPVEVLDFGGA